MGTLAVTDHDTLGGVAEATAAAHERGIRLVPGVELSVGAPSGSMHLLGYFPAPDPAPLRARLDELKAAREDRARRIVARLAEIGAPVEFEDVAARARGVIGRPHLADAVVAAGHATDRADAFARLLGDGMPAAVPHERLSPRDAIRLVRESGGAPVLAHPASLRMEPADLAAYVRRLTDWGLAGIEVHRPEHTTERRRELAGLAARFGLVPSGGSDFHHPGDTLRPGDTGDPPLPADTVERLLGS